jgi:hypothetical protein
MGLRDNLRRSLNPELHRCTPYAMQPCNSPPDSATGDATRTQQTGAVRREIDATDCATTLQQARCTRIAAAEPPSVQAQYEAFEERAAVREHDGRQSRPDAERGASVDLPRLSPAQADECHAGGWADAEAHSFRKRQALMLARGYAPEDAEAVAEALTLRDRQGDDRRICLECTHFGEHGRCLAASAGRISGADRRLEPVPTILQRCEAFGVRNGLTYAGPSRSSCDVDEQEKE